MKAKTYKRIKVPNIHIWGRSKIKLTRRRALCSSEGIWMANSTLVLFRRSIWRRLRIWVQLSIFTLKVKSLYLIYLKVRISMGCWTVVGIIYQILNTRENQGSLSCRSLIKFNWFSIKACKPVFLKFIVRIFSRLNQISIWNKCWKISQSFKVSQVYLGQSNKFKRDLIKRA